MSKDIFKDIKLMHDKFGVTEWAQKNKNNTELLKKFLSFRICKMMDEEMNELRSAAFVDDDAEGVVDSLIDLMVFCVTILDALGVDGNKAWDEVYRANMDKSPGVKAGRPNKFGLPDMVKDATWVGPNHNDNLGIVPSLFEKNE